MTEEITKDIREAFTDYMDKVDTLAKQNNELKQENKKLKYLISEEQCFEEGCNKCTKAYYTDDKYRSALEEIRAILNKECGIISNAKVVGLINEVLNESC